MLYDTYAITGTNTLSSIISTGIHYFPGFGKPLKHQVRSKAIQTDPAYFASFVLHIENKCLKLLEYKSANVSFLQEQYFCQFSYYYD